MAHFHLFYSHPKPELTTSNLYFQSYHQRSTLPLFSHALRQQINVLNFILALVKQFSKRPLCLTNKIHTFFTSESSSPGSGSNLPFELYVLLLSILSVRLYRHPMKQLPWHHPIGGTETSLINEKNSASYLRFRPSDSSLTSEM